MTTITHATRTLKNAYLERNRAIRRMYQDPAYIKVIDIAAKFELSVKRIYDICRGVKRPRKPIGCDKCEEEPYGMTGLCKLCYERDRRRTLKNLKTT